MAYTYEWADEINTVQVLITLEHCKTLQFKYIKSEDEEVNASSVLNQIKQYLPHKVCSRLKPV